MRAVGSEVQLDHEEEMELMHRIYGTLDAELAVQLTIKRAEVTTFLASPKGRLSAPARVVWTIKESLMDSGQVR